MQIKHPKGVKPKMSEDKLRSGVKWQGALKQKGAHGLSTRVLSVHDTTYNILGILSLSFSRRQRKYKLPSFKTAKNNSFM